MIRIESPKDIKILLDSQVKDEQLRCGEIFHLRDNSFSIHCIHCTQEFNYFTEFTLHIEEHFVSGELVRLKATSNEILFDANRPSEVAIKNEEPLNIDLEKPSSEHDYFEMMDSFPDDSSNLAETATKDVISQQIPDKLECNQDFTNLKNGFAHEIVNQIKFMCQLCFARFDVVNSIKEHIQAVHKGCDSRKAIRACCPLCPSHLANVKNTKKHIQNVHKNTLKETVSEQVPLDRHADTFKCDKCQREFTNFQLLRDHIRFTHKANYIAKPFACSLCGASYTKRGNVRTHIREKHNTCNSSKPIEIVETKEHRRKIFECFECHKQFSLGDPSYMLRLHMRYVHDGLKRFTCPLCLTRFAQTQNTKRHFRDVHGVTDQQLISDILEAQKKLLKLNAVDANSESRLHIEKYVSELEEHLQDKFECFECHQRFATLQLLRYHVRYTHGTDDETKPFHCPLCSARFSLLYDIHGHIRKVHKQSYSPKAIRAAQPKSTQLKLLEKSCICEICGSTFAQIPQLNRHMIVHIKAKRDKSVSKHTAAGHRKTHAGKLQPKCTKCDKRFSNKNALRKHKQTIAHNGERKFKCELCDKAYMSSGKLLDHRRKHDEEMPHVCKTCNKGFLFFKSLKAHQYQHERNT